MPALIGGDAVLVLPTAPGIAPLRDTSGEELDAFRARALELLCPTGHAGLPQMSMPSATMDRCPLGLSRLWPRKIATKFCSSLPRAFSPRHDRVKETLAGQP